jgi:tetratricopeptide (TPR) repeat protein
LLNYNTYFNDDDWDDEPYPDYFIKWDAAARRGKVPSGLISPEDLLDIIEIYLEEDNLEKARHAIEYTLKLYSDDDDILCDILGMLDEYELWNDLFDLCNRFQEEAGIEGECHKLTALVHLCMEAEAFYWFGALKDKYSGVMNEDREMLAMAYVAMSEALLDIDLYKSCNEVILEIISIIGEESDFLWIHLQCLIAMKNKKSANIIAEKIQKLFPLDAENWHSLGKAYQELGEIEKAIDAYEFAHSLNYESAENILHLILAYVENGYTEKAIERIIEYFENYEGSYEMYFMAAKLCAQLERWEDALLYIDAAIDAEPNADNLLYVYKSAFLVNMDEPIKAKIAILEGIRNTDDRGGKLREALLNLNKKF